jgi:hypothetical protein
VLLTHTSTGTVAARLAVTRDEIDAAERLVHDVYVARGLRDAGARPGGQASAGAVVFVARIDGIVDATLSLIPEGARGLPADALYGAELAERRRQRRRLAEISALAVEHGCRGATLALVRPLIQLVGIYARDIEGVDELCIAVHPRHARFYERAFGFTRFGDEKAYHAVKGAPAVGLRLDLHRPPLAGALSATLFQPGDIARVRAALDADLRGRAPALGDRVQKFQFRPPARAVRDFMTAEVC